MGRDGYGWPFDLGDNETSATRGHITFGVNRPAAGLSPPPPHVSSRQSIKSSSAVLSGFALSLALRCVAAPLHHPITRPTRGCEPGFRVAQLVAAPFIPRATVSPMSDS